MPTRQTQPYRVVVAGGILVLALALALSKSAAAQPVWVDRSAPPSPPLGEVSDMVDDSGRGRVVLLADGETWEYDGASWTRRFPAVTPPYRQFGELAYDSIRGVTVLFGGWTTSGTLDDTWEWNGTNWIARTPAIRPPSRFNHALEFDAARGRVVLFGGIHDTTRLTDTWEWSGASWVQRSPATQPPTAASAVMTYDSSRSVLVLAVTEFPGFDRETWEWDGTNWTQRVAAQTPDRELKSIAFDSGRGVSVAVSNSAGTFEYDGVVWVERSPEDSARRDVHIAYDSARGETMTLSTGLVKTWRWDGTTWTPHLSYCCPQSSRGLAFDPASGRTIALTYECDDACRESADRGVSVTWEWDGASWTRRPDKTLAGRNAYSMTYDSARGETVLFGGKWFDVAEPGDVVVQDTWVYDGAVWTERTPATRPPRRYEHAMAFDSARSRVVVFGGRDRSTSRDDTWEWDGTNWTAATPGNRPESRYRHAMAYDPARGRTVLFGGEGAAPTPLRDTWEWDGTDWTRLFPMTSPPASAGAAMAFDPVWGRLVLFGADSNSDLWTWDGTNWTAIPASVPNPGPRDGHGFAFDADRGEMVLYDGGGLETWVLRSPVLLARLGNVNEGAGARENVLFVNGSAGNGAREVTLAVGAPLDVDMASPSSRVSSPFAMYAWPGASTEASGKVMPFGIGTTAFPTPVTAACAPQPRKTWNNTPYAQLGAADFPSTAAPSRVLSLAAGLRRPLSATLQGLIRDDGSVSPKRFSVTNAVVIRVQ